MSITYIQPIFAPDKKRLDRNINSILSFSEYTKKYPGVGEIIFGGWSPDEEYWKTIRKTISDSFGHVKHKVIKFDRNYGKAVIVNELSKQINSNNKYILTADSDILFPMETNNMFERLIHSINAVVAHKKIDWGMIGLNQLEANCHLPCCYENQVEFTNPIDKNLKEKIVWPNGGGGIAGGCIFINVEAWKKVGGYRKSGVYAGDDSYLLIDLLQNGYSIQLIDTIGIIHPSEGHGEDDYAQWKVKVCQRDSGVRRDNIDQQICEAEEFWKSKKRIK